MQGGLVVLIVLETAAIAALGLLVAGLLRSHAEILRALHRLGAGLGEDGQSGGPGMTSPLTLVPRPATGVAPPRDGAPRAFDVTGTTPDDEAVAIGIVGARQDTLLAFLSTGCTTCATFWSAVADEASLGLPDETRLVVVTRDEGEESPSRLRRLAPVDVAVVLSTAAWEDYRVPGSPYFVLVEGGSGRVSGEGSASTWDQVRSLLAQAGDDARARSGGPLRSGAAREARADDELARAGIEPGDPRLHPPAGGLS